jgi:hypothetical protein
MIVVQIFVKTACKITKIAAPYKKHPSDVNK